MAGIVQRIRILARDLHINLVVQAPLGEPEPEVATAFDPEVAESSPSSTGAGSAFQDTAGDSPVAPAATLAEDWWLREVAPEATPEVLLLARQLRAENDLSPAERISLAYQRGRQAALLRRGSIHNYFGARCTLRNRCYVVLRGWDSEDIFFTWDFPTHQAAVRGGPTGEFARRAISHGFPSQAEATAFCLGAGLDDLPATR
eukprot:Skav231508  [mRNA]  locus=scaffold84:205076:205681:+ [translate_table: standard]